MTVDETIRYLEERVNVNPKSLLFARLADLYLKRGHIDEAITLCKKGIEHNPSYCTGNFILAKAYLAKSDRESAEIEFKKVIANDSQYMAAYKHLGDMMAKMGWENKAAMYYKDILRIDPLDETAREMLETFDIADESSGEIVLKPSITKSKRVTSASPGKSDSAKWAEELDEFFSSENGEAQTPPEPQTEQPDVTPPANNQKEETQELLDEDFKNINGFLDIDTDKNDDVLSEESNQPEMAEISQAEKPVTPDIPAGKEPEKSVFESKEANVEHPFSFNLHDENGTATEEAEQVEEETQTPLLEDAKKTETTDQDKSPLFAEDSTDAEQKAETEPEVEAEKETNQDDDENTQTIISPTLGEIYTAQGQFAKAIQVYKILLENNPDDQKYQNKIKELEKKLNEKK